jgi:predicted RNA binding protein YcfA (HicA-like mRNA interferase family)
LPRFRRLSGQQVCEILQRHGFVLERQRGSHIVMQRRDGATTITVPVPDHRELKIGTLLAIVRQSTIPREEFQTE